MYNILFLCSTSRWFFRPKHVVENNRINYRVLTGFIVIFIAQTQRVDELL